MIENQSINSKKQVRHIVFFDGVCNLCQRSVQFILPRDPGGNFLFASLQEGLANQLIPDVITSANGQGSIILWEEGKVSYRSTAVLRIAKKLSGLWPLLYVFILVPPFIRDGVYNLIAKNRYRWWGKTDTCMVPSKEWVKRFPASIEELENR
ncbi:MAG: thiol-disulfide oxidoreductase DCC family protein [Bacteroidota bacterium]